MNANTLYVPHLTWNVKLSVKEKKQRVAAAFGLELDDKNFSLASSTI